MLKRWLIAWRKGEGSVCQCIWKKREYTGGCHSFITITFFILLRKDNSVNVSKVLLIIKKYDTIILGM
ncbi:hypothetical protein GCM10008902_41660 [[Clostridium] innocuum]